MLTRRRACASLLERFPTFSHGKFLFADEFANLLKLNQAAITNTIASLTT